MGNKSKQKGYRGEVEVLNIVECIVRKVYERRGVPPPELSRSPNGRDIRGLSWMALEVKRVEADNPYMLNSWWTQTKDQAAGGLEPVLFYRMNNRPWDIRMFGYLDAGKGLRVRCPVDINLPAFSVWLENKIESSFGG